jgi:hypothetical protein
VFASTVPALLPCTKPQSKDASLMCAGFRLQLSMKTHGNALKEAM